MEQLHRLLTEDPSAAFRAGVTVPCALLMLLEADDDESLMSASMAELAGTSPSRASHS
jgi:hypothetical protein